MKTTGNRINHGRMAAGALFSLALLGGCQGSREETPARAPSTKTSQQAIEVRGAPVRIDAGYVHTLAVRQDGTVWSWGSNSYGELGDGTGATRAAPVQVPGLNNAVSVAAGAHYSLALKSDGTVWSWGYNAHGQLGDNTASSKSLPVQVNLSGVVAISASNTSYRSFALKSDGTVWAWGYNASGALGDNSSTTRYTPVSVKQSVGGVMSPLTDVVAISSGESHTLALKSNGTVWAWGANGLGQLGNGTLADQLTAVQVVNLIDAVAISAGTTHSLALKADGSAVSWGDGTYGQLGNGTSVRSLVPVAVSGLSNVKSLNAGGNHSLALKTDGTVVGWGYNAYGQLGNGSTTHALTPVAIASLTGVTAVSAGHLHSHALGSVDGAIWGWGYNYYGQVGDNTGTSRITPVTTLLTSGAQSLTSGEQHTVYVKWDGSVWAWGSNVFGNVGDDTPLKRLSPVRVKHPSGSGFLNNIVAVSAGTHYTLALASNGTVLAWGYNAYGQLGDGTTTSRSLPATIPGLTGIVAIAAGSTHALALKFNGEVYAWGRNHLGQLGDLTQRDRLTPGIVHYLDNVVAIAAGGAHSLAVQQNGTAYAWGNGSDGQLCDYGQGAGYFNYVISQIPNVPGIVGLTAGANHTLLLDATGKVWACGDNAYGQLGDGTKQDRSEPTAVALQGAGNIVRLVAGGNMSAIVGTTGTVSAWGYNEYSQLGDGTTVNRTVSTPIPNFMEVANLTLGTWHMSAVKANGSVWSWGRNNHGQMGDGSLTNRSVPTKALLP